MRFASFAQLAIPLRTSTWLALAPWLVGCGLGLDLSPPDPTRGDGAVSIDGGGIDGGGRDGSVDGSFDGAIDASIDAWAPTDAGMCDDVADCASRPRTGAVTSCEAWACVDGFCVENDYDGDGFGPGCSDARDCDDFDPTITLDGFVACPPELSEPGVCGASAFRECSEGMLADRCEGFVPPLEAEVCNGDDDDCDGSVDEDLPSSTVGEGRCAETLSCVDGDVAIISPTLPMNDGCVAASRGVDDDCDGSVDEDCVPDACVYVRLGEAGGDGSPTFPFSRLSDAISTATERGTNQVCLLATRTPSGCSTLAYTMPTIAVEDDLTVIGGLRADTTGVVTRCPEGPEATALSPNGANGIRVPSGVTLTLRDLVVRHPSASSGVARALEARGRLVLFNVRVRGSDTAGLAGVRTGVLVPAGGTLIAHASRIEAGPGNTAYAIDATDATVALLEGCGARGCEPSCTDLDHGLATSRGGAALRVNGGELLMDRVAVCVDRAATAVSLSGSVRAAMLRSFVEMGPSLTDEVRGVHASGCESFWMHESEVELTVGGVDAEIPLVVGIDVNGCPALLTDDTVDGLQTILNRRVDKVYGARCVDAPCTITGSSITGGGTGTGVLEAIGIGCYSGGCRYLADNRLVGTLSPSPRASGLFLDGSNATVTRNRSVGGCGEIAIGASVIGGNTRFTNNEAVGVICENAANYAAGLGVQALGGTFFSQNNSYDAGRSTSGDLDCNAAGLALSAESRFGTFRNDVFVAGECTFARAVVVDERPPVSFSHAGLVGTYYEVVGDREIVNATELTSAYATFVGNVFTNTPRFVDRPASLRIQPTSPFVGAGARLGSPRVDFSGAARPLPPSIGAWEP